MNRTVSSVVTEFTLFHAATNLFVSVSLELEQLPGGGVDTTHTVDNSHLYKYMSNLDNVVLACEVSDWPNCELVLFMEAEYDILWEGKSIPVISCRIFLLIIVDDLHRADSAEAETRKHGVPTPEVGIHQECLELSGGGCTSIFFFYRFY